MINQHQERFFLSFAFFFVCLSFLSCQHHENTGAGEELNAIITQSEDSIANAQRKDSCTLLIQLKGVDDRIIEKVMPISLNSNTDTIKLRTDRKGRSEISVPLNLFSMVVDNDTFLIETTNCGGSELKEQITLPYRTIRGRIMDKEGTPLTQMPIHARIAHREKINKRKFKIVNYENDLTFHTDSLGYYTFVVPSDAFLISLRSCGFLIGKISHEEMQKYPTQNFLFIPFKVKNICGYDIPQYHFYLNREVNVDMENHQDLFSMDDRLDTIKSIIVVGIGSQNKIVKRVVKRDAVFNVGEFRVCVND